jgi:hypothetical protein
MPANIEPILAVLLVIMFAALLESVSAFNRTYVPVATDTRKPLLPITVVCMVLFAVGLGAVACAIVLHGAVYKNAVILDNKEQKAVFENIKRSLDNVPTLVNYKTFESYEVRDAYNEYMTSKKHESLFKEALDAKGLKSKVPMTHSNTIWKPKTTSD